MDVISKNKGISILDRRWEKVKSYQDKIEKIVDEKGLSPYLYTIYIEVLKLVVLDYVLNHETYSSFEKNEHIDFDEFRQIVTDKVTMNNEEGLKEFVWGFVNCHFKEIFHMVSLYKQGLVLPIENPKVDRILFVCLLVVYSEMFLRRKEMEDYIK